MASHCYRRIVLQGVSKIEGESVLRLVPSYILQIRSSSSTVLSSSKNRGVQFDSSSPVFPNERKEAAKKSVASLWYSFQLLNHHHHHRRCRRCFSSFSSLNNDKGYTIDIQGTIPRNGQGVEVGQYAQIERRFAAHDVESFGTLIGDKNPLHDTTLEWDAALELMPFLEEHVQAGILETIHKEDGQDATRIPSKVNGDSAVVAAAPATTTKIRAVVHGMLVSSLFSSIFATVAPGCVYINQSLDFVSPVFVDDVVVGRLEITRVRQWPRRRRSGVVVTCDTQILRRVVPTDGSISENNNSRSDGSGTTNETVVLAVRGVANVWLPIGSQLPKEDDEMGP